MIDFSRALNRVLEEALNPAFVLPIIMVFAIGRLEQRYRGYKRDFSEIGANSLIFWMGFSFYALFAYEFIYSAIEYFEQFQVFSFSASWWSWILCYISVDFFYYWRHRIQHGSKLMWVDHSVHHSSTVLDASTALRLPWAMAYYAWVSLIPPVLLGFPTKMAVNCFYANLVYQLFIHHDHAPKLGWLEKLFNTPSHHRVHHGQNKEYFHKNFAGTLIVWDKVFGTFREETVPPEFGSRYQLKSKNPFAIHLEPLLIYLKQRR